MRAPWTIGVGLCAGAWIVVLAMVGGDEGARPTRDVAPTGDAVLAAIRALPPPARPFVPRTSLAQRYRPCPRARCDAVAGPAAVPTALPRLVAQATARMRERVDPAALHALALVDLLWADGSEISLDRAISSLQTVTRLADEPAPARVDLAAALLERAERRQDAGDLFEAAEMASLAVESDSLAPAARFNLALALDRVGLVDEAARAWNAYLARAADDGWAVEARTYATRAAVVARRREAAGSAVTDPQRAREYGWQHALGAWGAAVVAGDARRARHALDSARAIGDALERRGGDASLADAVRTIDANAASDGRLRRLAAAHAAFAAASADYVATRREDAARGFAAAAGAPGPLGAWATAFAAATHVYAGRRALGERMLREVLGRPGLERHPALEARVRWMLGTTLQLAGRTEAALQELRTASALYARIGERENLGAVSSVTAHAAYVFGDSRTTNDAVLAALAALREHRQSVWLYAALYMAAIAVERERHTHTALRLLDEDVAVAARTGNPLLVAEARLLRARLATHERPSARADVAGAERALRSARAGSSRDWLLADLRTTRAALHEAGSPAAAIAALDSVVEFFGRLEMPPRLVRALVARADARLRSGDLDGAGRDVDRALALLSTEQWATDSLPLRASLVDAAHAVVERAILLHVAMGDPRAALVRLDAARGARHATHARAARTAAPPRARAGETAVVYALIGDTLLTWTVGDGPVALSRATVSRERLVRAVDRARAALELRTADAARPDLVQLYDWLVRPIAGRLGPPGRALAIVAGPELAGVPFAALLDRERDRYLVESYRVRTAPSLHETRAAARPARTPSAGVAALVIADPAFDRARHPRLRPLQGAQAEARDVAHLYPAARLLVASGASAPAVAAALPRAALVHYAGHAVFHDERPMRSMLVLAPTRARDGGIEDGALTAERIAAMRLDGVRLVVLSACETVRSSSGGAGGFTGLSGAFLTAGVGGVVGAQWRVDDDATRALMHAFHREYRRTGDAAGALRAAQLALLRSDDAALRSPAAWAGFQYVGR